MINFRRICWCLLEGVPTLFAFPIDSSKPPEDSGNFWTLQWEYWPQYTVGILSLVVIAFTLAGCLCCQRQRRPKGFQEFKDGSTAGTETTIERVPSSSLELEVPRILTSSREKIPFDEISSNYADGRSAIKPPSSSLYNDDDDEDKSSGDRPRNEWYEGENFPREKLKYLREIGRGWFGKVVEGTTIVEEGNATNLGKNRGVVVRILTEGATSREKSWFLGESTPYLKLRHPNILELLGFCLETDPFLLLFESCPVGDLKSFLLENRKTGDALRKENVPMRMALNIANALEHMHENGFAHTDLSARNCLVSQDLSAKLGDYGVGVEKYPSDYYVVGDRALPIRWSAPESLQCTETTIETRAITPFANIWSYGVLLWEIATWAERPYDDLGDEQVIEMIFSIRNDKSVKLLNKLIDKNDLPTNFRDVLKSTWKFTPTERSSLRNVKDILCGKKMEDFERRWENLKPNGPASVDKSASLQDLRGSMDSELWQANSYLDKNSLRANFRLGPEEPVVNCLSLRETFSQAQSGSGSETEEESWRGRVERGAYTEKVKQKSKSVADLMVLVHIDSDSDVESSLGPQNIEKPVKKRLPPSGSDGDLRTAVIADEFDQALRKLRDPSVANGVVVKTTKNLGDNVKTGGESIKITNDIVENVEINENNEKPKLLTLTNEGKNPILRLSFGNPVEASSRDHKEEKCAEDIREEKKVDDSSRNATELSRNNEELVLRLVSKGNPDLPLLRYIPERSSTPVNSVDKHSSDSFLVAGNFNVPSSASKPEENTIDVELWNDALGHELEKKNPVFIENSTIFDESIEEKIDYFDNSLIIVPPAKDDYHGKILKSGSSTPKGLANFDVATNSGNHYVSGCLSAPTTPRHDAPSLSTRRAQESDEKVTKNTDYYPEDDASALRGSLSAPETPFRKSYNVTIHDEDLSTCEDLDERTTVKDSAPDTPQSRGNYSVGNCDEDLSSVGEELEEPGIMKRSSHEGEDEEDRKHLSTPDDERSSDSGFRDKESCEEEESPIPGSQVSSIILGAKISSVNPDNSSPLSASAEEEQMRILFELDTILDAEYYGGDYRDSDKIDESDMSLENIKLNFEDTDEIAEKIRSISESHGSTESTDILETVRANSCDANFLDNFFSAKEDTNQESKLEYLNDTSSADLLESIEADSVSEFSKIDENRSNSKKEDLLADISCESPIKTDKYPSTDSSVELVRLAIDSSESRGKSDVTTDFSLDTASDLIKNESSSDISPMKTDRNSVTDVSPDLRVESSDSRSLSERAEEKNILSDDIYKARGESESSSLHSVNKTDENNILENCTVENRAEMEGPSNTLVNESHANTHTKNTAASDVKIINLSTSPIGSVETENSWSDNATEIPTRSEGPTHLISRIDRGELQTSKSSEFHEKTEIHSSPINETHSANRWQADSAFLSPEVEHATSSLGGIGGTNHSRQQDVSEYSEENKNLGGPADGEYERNSSPENHDKIVSCSNETALLTIDDNRGSNISVDTQRDAQNSDLDQWSSRENINEEAEEDSSTMSLKSDNSYVSFGLDEAFVAAIRNELTEKLPRAQMPVVEALDPHDEAETDSINPETRSKSWGEDDDIEENPERSSVDISIRYNIYGTPLSPILEERESAATSESLFSKEESADASIASRVSALSEDVLVVDTRTNRAIILEAGANGGGNTESFNSQLEDDRDTSHGDISDEENLEYPHNNFNRGLGTKRITMGSGGAPLPSPEEESKWQQQFPLPLQMQDDLMSTSFGTDRDWDSQDDEEGEDEVEEGEDDEEENSSSSGEFVWKRYDESPGDLEKVATRSPPSKPKSHEVEAELDEEEDDEGEDGDEEDEEEEEEFTPSAWDATLAPHRSALRSPEKNLKSSDQKKSVWFKKQRYHCVYEYPKETPVLDAQGQVAATAWEPTSYADWEDMMDEPRLDVYPMEYDETNRAGDEEFYVSSSSRPFQFQSGDGKYVSQFFPGASTTLLQQESQQQPSSSPSPRDTLDLRSSQDEVDRADNHPQEVAILQANGNSRSGESNDSQQQAQLGELRHTRDRLKLNLLSTTGSTRTDGEAVPEIRPGESSNVGNIEGMSERIDHLPKLEKYSGNPESPEKLEKIHTGPKPILPSPEKPREEKEFLPKLEECVELQVDTQNFDEMAGKNENDESARCDKGTEKSIALIGEERLPIENQQCIAKEMIETQGKMHSEMGEEASNLEILRNLAVIETSKIENNKRDKEEKALCTDDDKSTNENVDIKVSTVKESKTFDNVEKVGEVGSTEGELKNFGDQKGECSSSWAINDSRKYENLEKTPLEKAINASSSEDGTRSEMVVSTSTTDSSKNGKNMDGMKETEITVQSWSQS